jgi:phosphohistidine phosphatase
MASRCVKLAGAAIRQRASTKLGLITIRTLHLLRHAKSSWDDESLADHERPLSPRGVRDAKRIGKHLGTLPSPPDLVLCSSAVRTRQTLDLIRSSLGAATVQVEEGLYGASAGELLDRLRGLPEAARSALVIGHNPGIQDLTLDLTAPGPLFDRVSVKFPTCALATLALGDRTWSNVGQGDAELVGFTIPRDLS